MNEKSNSESARACLWPWITLGAVVAAGATAFWIAKRRQESEGVDRLLVTCESWADALDRRLEPPTRLAG